MEFEDYLEPEVAIAAVVAAVVFSPKGRQLLCRGAVYGLAGVLVAGESIASVARGVAPHSSMERLLASKKKLG